MCINCKTQPARKGGLLCLPCIKRITHDFKRFAEIVGR